MSNGAHLKDQKTEPMCFWFNGLFFCSRRCSWHGRCLMLLVEFVYEKFIELEISVRSTTGGLYNEKHIFCCFYLSFFIKVFFGVKFDYGKNVDEKKLGLRFIVVKKKVFDYDKITLNVMRCSQMTRKLFEKYHKVL